MSQQVVFVETSVQVQRFLAEGTAQAHLDAELAAHAPNVFTANYVWMEFQRTVVADFAYVQRLMLLHHRWGDLLSHLLDGARSFQPRSAVRCTKILGLLHNQCEGDWEYAYAIATDTIQHGLEQRFWTHVTRLSDPIICDLVTSGITPQLDDTFTVASTCRKEQAACHLPEFLRAQQTKLHAIAEYLADHPNAIKGQDRVEQLLAAVLRDPRAALGQAACWPLGDLIIALQAPPEALIWTLDADFAALATALGLHHANPLAQKENPS